MIKITTKILSTDTEVSAYLHRTRLQILKTLETGPATVSQIGKKLGVHPANLSRHIKLLVSAGLVYLSETRDTGRNLEKYYDTTAHSFQLVDNDATLADPHKHALQYAASDITAAMTTLTKEDVQSVYALVKESSIPVTALGDLHKGIESLIEKFSAAGAAGSPTFHLNVSLYPVTSGQKAEAPMYLISKEE